jgi:hypothetical protein
MIVTLVLVGALSGCATHSSTHVTAKVRCGSLSPLGYQTLDVRLHGGGLAADTRYDLIVEPSFPRSSGLRYAGFILIGPFLGAKTNPFGDIRVAGTQRLGVGTSPGFSIGRRYRWELEPRTDIPSKPLGWVTVTGHCS